ncbi:unnamed protein product [Ectocarpus sp. CCAP 1310/34]|nr:unnamed protein product [Ectocarpus sp. CCAP 1310/34]
MSRLKLCSTLCRWCVAVVAPARKILLTAVSWPFGSWRRRFDFARVFRECGIAVTMRWPPDSSEGRFGRPVTGLLVGLRILDAVGAPTRGDSAQVRCHLQPILFGTLHLLYTEKLTTALSQACPDALQRLRA